MSIYLNEFLVDLSQYPSTTPKDTGDLYNRICFLVIVSAPTLMERREVGFDPSRAIIKWVDMEGKGSN